MRRSAFTLVELLVVISIVALLLAMLTPAMRSARAAAQRAVCAANQRQISVATIDYGVDNFRMFPHQRADNALYPNGQPKWIAVNPTTDPVNKPNWIAAVLPHISAQNAGGKIWQCPSIELSSLTYVPTEHDSIGYVANGAVTQFGGRNFTRVSSVASLGCDVALHNAAVLRPHMDTGASSTLSTAGFSGWMRFNSGELISDRPHEGKNLAFLDGHVEYLPQAQITSADFGLLINGQDAYEPNLSPYGHSLRIGYIQN